MDHARTNKPAAKAGRRTLLASVGQPLAILTTLTILAYTTLRVERPNDQVLNELQAATTVEEPPPPPDVSETPAPQVVEAPKPPAVDPASIARAEDSVRAARGDLARAEGRAREAADRLKRAQLAAVQAAQSAKKLPLALRDPTARHQRAKARGEIVSAEVDRLKGELLALAEAPRPRPKPLADRSPVARAPDGDEFHFEVRHDRVAFIDIDRLLEKVKSDARLQIRLTSGLRPVEGEVGPIGGFSMRYSVGAQMPDDPRDLLDGRVSFGLRGWEVVPLREQRGESYEAATDVSSDFARAIHRLSPGRDTITLWVYPDGFTLYRRLRDLLNQQGFLVAARPLPPNMPIRGSPSGSVSAGQ